MAVNSFTPVTPTYYSQGGGFAIAQMSLTASSGDTVNLFTVPSGFIVRSLRLDFVGTASSTIEVGDSAAAGRFIASATSTATTGTVSINATTAASSNVLTAGVGYQYGASGPYTIVATIGGANVSTSQYTFVLEGYLNLAS